MTLNSLHFFVFFFAVMLLFYIIPKRARTAWLLLAGLLFYISWDYRFLFVLVPVTVFTYFAGLFLGKSGQRKAALAWSTVILILVLGVFKYSSFALKNINIGLSLLHRPAVGIPFSIITPLGISFFTFKSIAYLTDVYKKKIQPERNFIDFALFVSFFPTIISGPIERGEDMLCQYKELKNRKFSYDKVVTGFTLMVFGVFLKMVVADRISIFVDNVYSSLQAAGSVETIIAALLYSLQIYSDFAGYSYIAIGSASMLQIDVRENFNVPYMADSISDFWKRWHISLSSFLKDYIYIPMGGNRVSRFRKYVNIMVTFLVSGLWHGASWTFVLWGFIHGIYQIIGDILKPVKAKLNSIFKTDTTAFSYKFGRALTTFILVTIAWIPFRAGSFDVLKQYVSRMSKINPWVLFNGSLYCYGLDRTEVSILMFGIALMVLADIIKYVKGQNPGEFLLKQNLWFRWIFLIIIIVSMLVFGEYGVEFNSANFIYLGF